MKKEHEFVVLVSHLQGVKQERIAALAIAGPTLKYRHALTSALALYRELKEAPEKLPAQPCILLALVSETSTPDTVRLRLVVDVRGGEARGFWMHSPLPGGGWAKTGLSEWVPVTPNANSVDVVQRVWSTRQWTS
ncbi:hypothetical protein OKW41_006305 [Paraburkholderia sp. UCT70]|uniref:hypothetical protein n=1 Tax=Paraburkholderia sp. UCT70 TaxID=2991068 RepID=UPI003D20FCC0